MLFRLVQALAQLLAVSFEDVADRVEKFSCLLDDCGILGSCQDLGDVLRLEIMGGFELGAGPTQFVFMAPQFLDVAVDERQQLLLEPLAFLLQPPGAIPLRARKFGDGQPFLDAGLCPTHARVVELLGGFVEGGFDGGQIGVPILVRGRFDQG